MRLVFVTSMHPDCGLVGGVRLFRFAQELAFRGHQVILLCSDGPAGSEAVDSFRRRLAGHDWCEPFVLATGQLDHPVSGKSKFLRKAGTALRLFYTGGPYPRWRRSALAFASAIIEAFRPQLCYATFDCLDSLAIGRNIALRAGVPWVMDIKDPAVGFIPAPLRGWLMRRFKDASAVTLNSEFQRSRNPGWADENSVVIYSGVEPVPATNISVDASSIALVGSLYEERQLENIIRGFDTWRKVNGGNGVLHYFGIDADVLVRVLGKFSVNNVVIEGQNRRLEFLNRCASMSAIIYIHSENTFHHKLLELAALGRPLLICPGEGDEGVGLAAKHGIAMSSCSDADSVASCLARASATQSADMSMLSAVFGWPSVARQLESVFLGSLGELEQTIS